MSVGRLTLLALLALVGGCERRAVVAPYWATAQRATVATDDPTVKLRKGFGIQLVDQRGGAGRSSEGHWFSLEDLEPARPSTSAPASPPEVRIARPGELGSGERWIDIDSATQTLVACEGDRALRAMKISSGVGEDGAMYSTPRGTFRIYAKLRSATMASEPPAAGAPPDPHPYRFEAVPHVQYFHREIALHGAYWHRRFGERVSHGCVNLAPGDAAWLFDFTSPRLSASERERALSKEGKLGTLVRVR